VTKICSTIPDQLCDELDLGLASGDALQGHLRNEYENGRLLRLLLKLGFMNERPENASAPSWSETGDRYILKLYRDYLFHQQMPDGTPVIDCGHIVSSLNKVDAGDPEQIIMTSRNGKDLLIASHADIHRCLEESFVELAQLADPTSILRNPEDVMFAPSPGMDPYFVPLAEPSSLTRSQTDYFVRGGGGRHSGRVSSRGGRGRGRGREAAAPVAAGFVTSGRGSGGTGAPPPRPVRQRTFPGHGHSAGGAQAMATLGRSQTQGPPFTRGQQQHQYGMQQPMAMPPQMWDRDHHNSGGGGNY